MPYETLPINDVWYFTYDEENKNKPVALNCDEAKVMDMDWAPDYLIAMFYRLLELEEAVGDWEAGDTYGVWSPL